jgi:mRNA interferase MazF
MKEGDIAKAALNQADGKIKFRPVLLSKKMPPFGDWLVCGITSKLQNKVEYFDLMLNDDDPDFKDTGLVRTSLIRPGFMAVIPENVIEGTIGKLSDLKYNELINSIILHLKKKI